MRNVKAIVRGALAEHVGLEASAVQPWHELDRDLEVTQIDLALIGLEIENAVGVELPMEGFGPVETVDDLCAFVARVVAEERGHKDYVHDFTDLPVIERREAARDGEALHSWYRMDGGVGAHPASARARPAQGGDKSERHVPLIREPGLRGSVA